MKSIVLSNREYDELCAVLYALAGAPRDSDISRYICSSRKAFALFDILTLEGLGLQAFGGGQGINEETWHTYRRDAKKTVEG